MKVTLQIGYDTFYAIELADAAKVMELLGRAQAFETRYSNRACHNVQIERPIELHSGLREVISREDFAVIDEPKAEAEVIVEA